MTTRLSTSLAVLAALFVLMIGWLGRQLTLGEEDALRKERDQVVDAALSQLSSEIDRYFDQLGGDLARRVSGTGAAIGTNRIEAFRRSILNDSYVSRIFLIGEDEKLLYPRGSSGESEGERDLVQLIAPLIKNRAFVPRQLERPAKTAGAELRHWWHAAHWRDGLHLFLLSTGGAGDVVGVEVNCARVLSDLFVLLTRDRPAPPFGGFLQVTMDDGTVLVTRGNELAKVELRRELSLAPPLQSFRAAISLAPIPLGVRSSYFNLTAGALLLGVTTMLLGIFAVREYRRELREAETRVSFVGKVSHELRTPLTNVRLYAELLEQRIDEEDEVGRKYLGIIIRESERLSRLIGNVLRLGESDRGKLAVKRSPGDPAAIVRSIVDLYRPAVESHGMKLRLESGEIGERLIDRDALSQIVHNLLSNAEKYARNGTISVALRADGQTAMLEIGDEGPGVPAELRERIFEPFFRVSNELTDGVAGTGIGLGIARELARLHGGDLVIVPSPKGLTLRLTIDAPLAGTTGGRATESDNR